MSIYTISDLHLSFGTNKPMNIFKGWDNHIERLTANWKRLVKENDTVVLPGDFSWALKIEEALEDFKFIDSLPGKKVLLKGNHDLWWSTVKKIREFWQQNNISTFDIVFNNCVIADGFAIAGTRGWFYDEKGTAKIKMREAGRLDASLTAAEKTGMPILTFLHYPPVYADSVCEEILDVLKKHNVKKIYYGHIHGAGFNNAVYEYEGIKMTLVSCDCIDFTPYLLI
ncbi:MAG: serine/threonine protein phosphatase [Ruminococcaceae bacterium]|nr:serine/threonine protein phosphatase [Oscillospiraceae bacterium]